MSSLKPIFQFDFQEISNGKVADQSGNGNDAAVFGNCQIVKDPDMGKCIDFDGSSAFLELGVQNLDFSTAGYSFCCWVNVKAFAHFSPLFNFALNESNSISIQQRSISGTYYFDSLVNGTNNQIKSPDASVINANEWTHIALTVDAAGNAVMYFNGNSVAASSAPNLQFIPELSTITTYQYIGKGVWPDSVVPLLNAKMAWVTLYDKGLSTSEVVEDMMQLEQRDSTLFQQQFPLDFNLYSENNTDKVPVLYLEGAGEGKNLYLEIENTSSQTITISQNATPASSTNYDLKLRFRPGILSDRFMGQGTITLNANWSAFIHKAADNTISINIVRTGSTITLAPNEKHTVTIPKVNANAVGGSRNTNVEFLYQVTMGASNIEGTRLQSLSIVSHLGQKDIPLHVDIVGTPSILNDGKTSSELFFRVKNMSDKAISLGTNPASTFIVNIPIQATGSSEEWALIDQGNESTISLEWPVVGLVAQSSGDTITLMEPLSNSLAGGVSIDLQPPTGSVISAIVSSSGAQAGATSITLTTSVAVAEGTVVKLATNNAAWNIQKDTSSNTVMSYTITNVSESEIAPGTSLDFIISGIVCTLPNGQAIISLHYQNIPGFWDGNIQVSVGKSPITTHHQNVGIGIEADDTNALRIGTNQQQLFAINDQGALETTSLMVSYPAGQETYSAIQVGSTGATHGYAGIYINADNAQINFPFLIGNTSKLIFEVDTDGNLTCGTLNSKTITADGSLICKALQANGILADQIKLTSGQHVQCSNFGFLNPNGAGGPYAGTQAPLVSVYANDYMVAAQFFTHSDARIKENIRSSVPKSDLQTLLKIRVVDYQYIDIVNKGTQTKKGFIAQEVEQVLPDGITVSTDFVPDIFAMSKKACFDPALQQLGIELEKPHGLKKGDLVKLYDDKGDQQRTVARIDSDTRFTIDDWQASIERIFVFGKQVDDFKSVDYDQIATVGVSAIQELNNEVAELKDEVKSLKEEMAMLKALILEGKAVTH